MKAAGVLRRHCPDRWMQSLVEDPYLQGVAGTQEEPRLLCPPSGPERLDRGNMSFSRGVTAPL